MSHAPQHHTRILILAAGRAIAAAGYSDQNGVRVHIEAA